ncbi:MAG: hypothetical protein IKU36_05945 [Bacteroidales bacterium]|nr:hypothetical protein [Bacteroidales bacterium]
MGSSVDNAKSLLLQAESRLRSAKDCRDQAKQNGTYKNSPKNYRLSNGKVGTVHDHNVDAAQQEVKRCKANLAAAKKK